MITLKAVKYFAQMSEETHCYTATVCFNNRPAAKVSNRGHGGPDEEYITNQAAWKEMTLYIAGLKPREISWGTGSTCSMPQDLEGICCNLVNDWLAARDLKRLMAKRVVYTLKGKPGLYQTNCASSVAARDVWIARMLKSPNTGEILNTVPFDDALKLFNERMK